MSGVGTVIVLGAVLIAASCNDDEGDSRSNATTTASAMSPAEKVAYAARVLDRDSVQVETVAPSIQSVAAPSPADDFVVTFRIAEGSAEGLTRARLSRSVYDFLERLRDSEVDFHRVIIRGSLTEFNKYGEIRQTPPTFEATFDTKTVHKIQYQNIEVGELAKMRHLTATPMVVKQPLRDDAWTWSSAPHHN